MKATSDQMEIKSTKEIFINVIFPVQSSDYKSFFTQGLITDENNFRISINDEQTAPFPTKGTVNSSTLGAYVVQDILALAKTLENSLWKILQRNLRELILTLNLYTENKEAGI